MMGTLAMVLAGKKIRTPEQDFRADVEGDIENMDGVLKITEIRVNYHLKVQKEKSEDARAAFSTYIKFCPAAQSVIGCIRIRDELEIEEKDI
jgi:organic hydroperoxide reductase OsmC/OhrA